MPVVAKVQVRSAWVVAERIAREAVVEERWETGGTEDFVARTA